MIPLRRRTRFALLALSITALVGACGTAGPTGSAATPDGSVTPTAELTPVPGGTEQPSSPASGGPPLQTDTDWGRIWDAIPDSFPRPDGSNPADPLGGPASGAFSIGGAPVDVVTTMSSGLAEAGYSTDQSLPLEDGSIVIDAVGADPACRVQVQVTPLSGTTHMTVLYGAGCPFE
ncbi:MAG TPA: hypothetical protein VFO73_00725 [Candidatus Limnocylindrales bacterium]|nr:hypothetical protein [Candidatus Limnocylindrales bacterium]